MKKTTKTDNSPWAPAQPFILKNLQQQDDVFNSSQPDLMKYSGMQRDTYGRVAPGAEQGITGAQSLVNRNLSGANLRAIPTSTRSSARRVTTSLARSTTSSARRGGSARGCTRRSLRASWRTPRPRRATRITASSAAISSRPSAMRRTSWAARNRCSTTRPNCRGSACRRPTVRSGRPAAATARRPRRRRVRWATCSCRWLRLRAQAGAAASDRRLKMDIEKVGEDADGLGRYRYRYVTDDPAAPLREGVMADEVATLRPWALGPTRNGFATVDYGAL
jgi:hypothetical protein